MSFRFLTYKYIKFKYKVYLYFPLCFISLAICSFIIQKAIFEQTEGLVLRNAQRNHSHFKMAQILFFYFFLWFHIGILIFNIHGIYCVMSWDKNLIYFQVVNYWVWCSLSSLLCKYILILYPIIIHCIVWQLSTQTI